MCNSTDDISVFEKMKHYCIYASLQYHITSLVYVILFVHYQSFFCKYESYEAGNLFLTIRQITPIAIFHFFCIFMLDPQRVMMLELFYVILAQLDPLRSKQCRKNSRLMLSICLNINSVIGWFGYTLFILI